MIAASVSSEFWIYGSSQRMCRSIPSVQRSHTDQLGRRLFGLLRASFYDLCESRYGGHNLESKIAQSEQGSTSSRATTWDLTIGCFVGPTQLDISDNIA